MQLALLYTSFIMHPALFLLHQLVNASSSWWLFIPIIILGTMVLEDVTIATVGVLSADNMLPIPLSIFALIIGIVISDSFAYTIGHLALRYKFAKRIIEHERIAPLRTLLKKHANSTMFTTRFLPGLRFALYATCGVLSVPFKRFLLISITSATVWTTVLFSVSFLFGFYTLHLLGHWRWPILIVVLLGFFMFSRHHWKKMTSEQEVQT